MSFGALVVVLALVGGCGGGDGDRPSLGARARSAPTSTSIPVAPGTSLVAQATAEEIPVFEAPETLAPQRVFANPWLLNDDPALPVRLVFLVRDREDDWVKVLLPERPNGSTAWVRADDVEIVPVQYRIRVELGAHRITVYDGTSVLLQEAVAVGAPQTPTPPGTYYLRVLLQAPDPNTVYGPFAYGLSGHSDVLTSFNGGDGELGIHGNNDASVLGQDATNGCVRMSNEGITRLDRAAAARHPGRDRAVRRLVPLALLVIALGLPAAPVGADIPSRRLPPADRDEIAAIFDPLLEPLGLRTTRAALQRTDNYEQDPDGRHLAVYVEPIGTTYTDAQFVDGYVDVARVYLPPRVQALEAPQELRRLPGAPAGRGRPRGPTGVDAAVRRPAQLGRDRLGRRDARRRARRRQRQRGRHRDRVLRPAAPGRARVHRCEHDPRDGRVRAMTSVLDLADRLWRGETDVDRAPPVPAPRRGSRRSATAPRSCRRSPT